MTRVVQLANFYGPSSGGLKTALEELGRCYTDAGIDRVLIVPGPRDDETTGPSGTRLSLRAPLMPGSGGYRMMVSPRRIDGVLASLRPDVVEVSDKLTLVRAGHWARGRGVRAVLLSHERIDAILADRVPPRLPLGSVADRWNQRISRAFDVVVCPSRFALAEFERIGARNTAVVPWGVDLGTFSHQAAAPRRRAAVELACVGRLSKEKRPDVALEAMAELARRGIDAHLTMLGDGPLRSALMARARSLAVTFAGHVADRDEVAGVLAGADVTLAPCPAETFGLSVLESLACGTPVVTAGRGGALEVIDADCGLTAASSGPSVVDAVTALLRRDQHRVRTRARARAERFPWSAAGSALLAVHGVAGTTPADAMTTCGPTPVPAHSA